MDNKQFVIGVFCHYAGDNLGEQASIDAVLRSLERLAPHALIRQFPARGGAGVDVVAAGAATPRASSEQRDEVQPSRAHALLKRLYPLVMLVRFLRNLGKASSFFPEFIQVYRQVRDVDLLMIVGSNQCFDYCGGPWNFPYALLKWSLAAKLSRAKLAYVSVGAGPIISAYSKAMIRWSLALADYRSYRDQVSKDAIMQIRAGGESDGVLPDLAFSFPLTSRSSASSQARPVRVAINPMPMFDARYWPQADTTVYEGLLDKFVALTSWLEQQGHEYFFYGTHPKDALVVEDMRIRSGSTRPEFRDTDIYPNSVEELMARIDQADVVIAMRFHGIVLPFALGKPVLGVEYWKKTTDLMTYMDQREYLVAQEELLFARGDFQLEAVTERLSRLIENRALEAQKIQARLKIHRAALEQQYRDVLALTDIDIAESHSLNQPHEP